MLNINTYNIKTYTNHTFEMHDIMHTLVLWNIDHKSQIHKQIISPAWSINQKRVDDTPPNRNSRYACNLKKNQ